MTLVFRRNAIRSRSRIGRGTGCLRSATADTRGATLVEFAILVPVLLLFSFGIISYAWWYFLANGLQLAANDGARASIAGIDATERQTLAFDRATDNLRAVGRYDMRKTQVSVVEQSNRLTVTVTYDSGNDANLRLPLVPAPPSRIVERASILLGGV